MLLLLSLLLVLLEEEEKIALVYSFVCLTPALVSERAAHFRKGSQISAVIWSTNRLSVCCLAWVCSLFVALQKAYKLYMLKFALCLVLRCLGGELLFSPKAGAVTSAVDGTGFVHCSLCVFVCARACDDLSKCIVLCKYIVGFFVVCN